MSTQTHSTVVLTPEIRKIPYFSSFSDDEKEVIIPKPFINESINYKLQSTSPEDISIEELLTTIENRAYLNLENDELVRELLWKLGETKETWKRVYKLSCTLQKELQPYLDKDSREYVYGIRYAIDKTECCKKAAMFGNLRLLKWARQNDGDTGSPYHWNEDTCSFAAYSGCLDILKWARENGCPWDEWTCACAAGHGYLDILKWARENCCPWDENSCLCAAKNNHLEVLKFLRENDGDICPWSELVTAISAEYGNLEVLKWLRSNGCPWDERVCSYAAKNNHLEVLKWARENGCPWNSWTCITAEENGHLELLKWARDNGCPWNGWTRIYASSKRLFSYSKMDQRKIDE